MRSIPIFLASLFGLIGCSEKFEVIEGTGLKGTVYAGSGGCGADISEADKHYDLYNGPFYFLDKSDFDSHIELNQANAVDSVLNAIFSHMKGHSFSTWVGHGKLDVEVPTGTYYLATRDVMRWNDDEVIKIHAGTVLELDLWFWECIDS